MIINFIEVALKKKGRACRTVSCSLWEGKQMGCSLESVQNGKKRTSYSQNICFQPSWTFTWTFSAPRSNTVHWVGVNITGMYSVRGSYQNAQTHIRSATESNRRLNDTFCVAIGKQNLYVYLNKSSLLLPSGRQEYRCRQICLYPFLKARKG